MTLVAFNSRFHDFDVWNRALRDRLPEFTFVPWPPVEPSRVEALLCWDLPADTGQLSNLKFIQCLGAGVDHLLSNPETPRDIPIARIVHVDQVGALVQFVSASILAWHRQLPLYRRLQSDKTWGPSPRIPSAQRKVGVMGLGKFGAAVAQEMARLGFQTRGLSRSGRPIENIQVFSMSDVTAFITDLDAVICTLPLTPDTIGILSRRLFERMSNGAHIINVGRGEHLIEADLIDAFASGRMASASLDVFRTEPLPPDSPLWAIPGVEVTPHVATSVRLESAIDIVAENLRAAFSGAPISDLVDRQGGY
jgi:glyoxylate/hydroxypyruvate reductase A